MECFRQVLVYGRIRRGWSKCLHLALVFSHTCRPCVSRETLMSFLRMQGALPFRW